MRKTWKCVLSLVLSAAMVVTAGASGIVQGDKTAKAADVLFTASFNSFGGFWGWDATTPTTPDAWSVDVTGAGDYTVKLTAPTDWDFSGAFVVNTNVAELPAGYSMVGKSVKIGSTTYDWSKATAYLDSEAMRLSIWNEWGKDDNGGWDPKANPLKDDPTDLSIKKGDEIEATFTVNYTEPWFVASFNSFGGFWGWDATTPTTPGAWSVAVDAYGDYTVSMEAPADWDFSGAFVVNTTLTDLPTTYDLVGKTVKIGNTEYDWSKGVAYKDGENVRLSIWNEWGKDDNGGWDSKANPLKDDPTDLSIKKGDKIEATFTVKAKGTNGGGNNGGNPTNPPSGSVTTKVNGPKKGATFTAGNFKYKVTKAATITSDGKKKTAGKVTVVSLTSKAKKKATSINVKNTAKKGTASYTVTGVNSKAFQKAKKLKKATLGSKIKSIPTSAFNADKKLTTVKATGVTKIGKSAFKGCVKLNKLTLGKKKLSSVKKGAFKGCKKKIKVSGGSKKVKKANVKKLKKSGYKKFK